MILDFKNLRPPANYPVYPSYHTGYYLEEYFYRFYLANKLEFDRTGFTLIPVFWTNVYNNGMDRKMVQYYLNALPKGRYFTVSQHDDAVSETLPEGTLSFEAGGNRNGIPIPLICSPLPLTARSLNRDIFCSFVGSDTHPVRSRLLSFFSDNPRFKFSMQQWSPVVAKNKVDEFIQITSRSKFALCPRGYGAQSFRLYEVLQLKSIPVVICDKAWFPFSNEINWDSFCVRIPADNIGQLELILDSIPLEKQIKMQSEGSNVYNKYFTLEQTCKQILKHLKEHNAL